ncbi:MAG: hypothetical protein AAGK97_17780, partial [Bacteroidota bacterium]
SLLIGSPDTHNGGWTGTLYQGAVYHFEFNGTVWKETQRFMTDDGGQFQNFGKVMARSGDYAIFGDPESEINGNISQGAIYIFEDQDTAWVQVQKLSVPEGHAFSFFGRKLDIENELIAASGEMNDELTVYVIEKGASDWQISGTICPEKQQENMSFGNTLKIQWPYLFVGALLYDYGNAINMGGVFVFENLAVDTWKEKLILTPELKRAGSLFSSSIDFNGATILVGANNALHGGAIYFFEQQ